MQPNYPYQQPAPPPQQHDYSFITNPGTPQRRGPSLLPSTGSPVKRIAIVVGGVFILLILFIILKGALSGKGNTPALIAVAQEQQQIIHLTTTATTPNSGQTTSLSISSQNFAVTALASVTSGQQQLLTYLSTNGHSVKGKTLALRISANLDQELKTAATNSTYDTAFKQIMQTQLDDYQQALRTAYQQTSGPKGRKLLNDQFLASQLLAQQLNSPSS